MLIPTGTSTSKGCSKPPDQSVHGSDGTAAQNGSDNMKQLNVTQIQVTNIQIMSPTVSQPEKCEVPAPQDLDNEGITDSAINQVAAEVPKKNVAEIFRIFYATLSEALVPDEITPALFSKGLISKLEKNEINVQGQTQEQKATKLLAAVQRAIHAEQNNFYTFLKLLNKHKEYKLLVMNIMKCVTDATPDSTTASGSSITTTSSTPGSSGSSTTTTSSTLGSSGSSTTTTSSTPGSSGSSTTTTFSTPSDSGSSTTTTSSTPGDSGSSTTTTSSTPGDSGSSTTTTSSTPGPSAPSGSSATTTSSTPGPSGSSATTTSSTPGPSGPSGSSAITTSSTPGPSGSSTTTPGSSQNEVEDEGATDSTSTADSSGLPPNENDGTSETSNQSRITVISSFISSCPVWLKTSLIAVLLGIVIYWIVRTVA
ncbi:hypothetical protein EMCRGX_G030456 [Ephydatia muelleri]